MYCAAACCALSATCTAEGAVAATACPAVAVGTAAVGAVVATPGVASVSPTPTCCATGVTDVHVGKKGVRACFFANAKTSFEVPACGVGTTPGGS